MRRIAGLAGKLAIAWCVWWVAATFALNIGLSSTLSGLTSRGWTAEAETGGLAGFPARLVLPLRALAVRAPDGAPAFEAPRMRVEAAAWNPFRAGASWSEARLDLATRAGRIEFASGDGRAGIGVAPGPALLLASASLEARDLRSEGLPLDGAAAVSAEGMRVEGARYVLRLRGSGLGLAGPVRALLDPEGRRPAAIDEAVLDAELGLDRPLSLLGLQATRLAMVDLRSLEIVWGSVALSASGRIAVDGAGLPEGTLTLASASWRELLALAVAGGLLAPESARTAEQAMSFLERDGSLSLPLTFTGGLMALGPIPLGPAPRLIPPQRQ